jgi:uncharacterized phiE125 gp8 family phage protein
MSIISIGGYGLRSYGSLALVDPQTFTEPFTIEEMQSFLKIPTRDPGDEIEDATILSFISAARRIAEDVQGRDLIQKQWNLTMDYWPDSGIEVRTPLVSVASVTYKNSSGTTTTMVANTDFIVDSVRGVISPVYGQTFPPFTAWPSSAITVRFTSGVSPTSPFWSDAGALIKVGMRLLISDWFNRRLPEDVSEPMRLPGHILPYLSYGARAIL